MSVTRGVGVCPFCEKDHGKHTPTGPTVRARLVGTNEWDVIPARAFANNQRRWLKVIAYMAPELVEAQVGIPSGTYAAWIEHKKRRIEEVEGAEYTP